MWTSTKGVKILFAPILSDRMAIMKVGNQKSQSVFVDPCYSDLFLLVLIPSLICPGYFQSALFICLNHNSSALSSQTLPVLPPLFLNLFSYPLSCYPFQFFKPSTISSHFNLRFSFQLGLKLPFLLFIQVGASSSSSDYFIFATDTFTHRTSLIYESLLMSSLFVPALPVLASLSSLHLLLSTITHWLTSFFFLDLLSPFSLEILVSSCFSSSFTFKFLPQSWFPPLSFLSWHNPECRCDSRLICIWQRLPASRKGGSITGGKGGTVFVLFLCICLAQSVTA